MCREERARLEKGQGRGEGTWEEQLEASKSQKAADWVLEQDEEAVKETRGAAFTGLFQTSLLRSVQSQTRLAL